MIRLNLNLLFCVVATALAAVAHAQLAGEGQQRRVSTEFQPRAGRHVASGWPEEPGASSSLASADELSTSIPEVTMAPTRSSFLAHWNAAAGVTAYRLDVSTSPWFGSYVQGYHNLEVGNVTNRIVNRLEAGTKYYYRVRSYNEVGASEVSEVMTGTTATTSGLVINPTFDTSITGKPNAAAIESMINRAIALYQPLFSDAITAEIRFRYAETQPDGTPLGEGHVAQSNYVVYEIPWSVLVSALRADAKTTNDGTANSSIPSTALSTSLVTSSADGRAVQINTPPAMFADGTVGPAGPYDGIVTLNSTEPLQFTRPPSSGNYDAEQVTEHEMDEILGLGSYLGGPPSNTNLRPQDIFSWSAPGTRSHSALGTRYFSIDNGNTKIVDFNQDPDGDFGDWLSGPCPQPHPYVQNAFGCKGQSSDVKPTSPEGINLDVVGYDLTAAIALPGPAALGNISTRGLVKTENEVLIGGFIVDGTQPKKVIVGAIGPSLPIAGVLANPSLELHDSTSAIIASNDNWRSDQQAEIVATGFAPHADNESAIVMTLSPGSYTAVVAGVNGGTGIALVEIYDLDQTADSKLANISTRGFVGTMDDVLIGGFIVVGDNPSETIIRAIGPSLADAGITNVLPDPTLELHDGNGTTITSNDDWRTSQESEIIASGFAPARDTESAIVATLAPGSYTAIVSGKASATGIALVEVYQLTN